MNASVEDNTTERRTDGRALACGKRLIVAGTKERAVVCGVNDVNETNLLISFYKRGALFKKHPGSGLSARRRPRVPPLAPKLGPLIARFKSRYALMRVPEFKAGELRRGERSGGDGPVQLEFGAADFEF